MAINVRYATPLDRDAIRDIHMQAFSESENEIVAKLALELMEQESTPEILSLIAESGGEVVGHAVFSPVSVDSDKPWLGYILGPLAVKPEFQNQGIGRQLVERGIEQLSGQGIDVLFVYGDPEYYVRFGFEAETAERYHPPYKLKYPFGWLAMVLQEGDAIPQVAELSCLSPLCNPELW